MLSLSSLFFVGCKVSIKPIVLRQKMTACRIWRIDHHIINILVELSNSVSESCLFNHFSISHLISFFSGSRLNVSKLNLHWLTLSTCLMTSNWLLTIIVKIIVLVIVLVAACLVILVRILRLAVLLLLHILKVLLLLHLLLVSHLLLLILLIHELLLLLLEL